MKTLKTIKKDGFPSGCALSGILNRRGELFSGTHILDSIAQMHDRSNGLGGGFAAYGIYPEYRDFYALHMLYENKDSRDITENFLKKNFYIEIEERIPTRSTRAIYNPPILWRYFIKPMAHRVEEERGSEEDFMVKCVMEVNENIDGAYVISSGQNMGVFKGVGFPEDIGEFYRLDDYQAYLWIAHGRFPTNTPGWWGGAHPFGLLNWTIVHNGEVSSYGTNRRYLEMFNYRCTLQTDTEVIAYAIDLLLRKFGLPIELMCKVLAPPLWKNIDLLPPEDAEVLKTLRILYGDLLMNGPFSIILGFENGMVALNDRIKLRPLVAAEKGEFLYIASEESAISAICSQPDRIWYPKGGEPVIGYVEGNGRC
ncbi:hypothetical protein DRQ11_09770 [candidate division KSB1 bacterium]|nr:MAG: hypothetical protein DRQ11_09770 [candidate division KSB1 bacterium]